MVLFLKAATTNLMVNAVYESLCSEGNRGKDYATAKSIHNSATHLTITINILKTIAAFRYLINLSFQRLAITAKLIITVLSFQFCFTALK